MTIREAKLTDIKAINHLNTFTLQHEYPLEEAGKTASLFSVITNESIICERN